MNHKQVETSREIRLWVTQVIIPILGIGAMIPEVRHAAVEKFKEVKNDISRKTYK